MCSVLQCDLNPRASHGEKSRHFCHWLQGQQRLDSKFLNTVMRHFSSYNSRVMNPPPKLAPTFLRKYASKYGICFMLRPSVKVRYAAPPFGNVSELRIYFLSYYINEVYVMASSEEVYRKQQGVWATLSRNSFLMVRESSCHRCTMSDWQNTAQTSNLLTFPDQDGSLYRTVALNFEV